MSTIATQGVLVQVRSTTARGVTTRDQPVLRSSASAPTSRMRLTLRGRVVLVALAALLAFGIGSVADRAQATQAVEPASYVTVVVAPGESLWTIASSIAGDRDVRDVVAMLLEINDLATSDLLIGQTLLVPEALD